jgi:predicted patatin/cPLA2 family phospholipase
VQIDYQKDGNIDHSMMVTQKVGNGNTQIYLTYSNHYDTPYDDKKNVTLDSILKKYPTANFYAWQVKY